MKIVHISHLYHPSEGGVQFFFKNISERLVKKYGDDVTIVTTNSFYGPERKAFKKIEPAHEKINGVNVIRFSYRRWHLPLYSFIFKLLAKLHIQPPEEMLAQANGPYSKQMKHYLMNTKADAFCGSSSNYYFMQLPLWRSCNFFYYGSIHLPEDESKRVLTATQLNAINKSTLYLANTCFEKKRLTQAGVQADKIFVLGTGVDMAELIATEEQVAAYKTQLDIPITASVIGYVGRIEKTKNVQAVIKSFAALAEDDANIFLLVAGSASDYLHELQTYCTTLAPSINNRIKWQVNFTIDKKSLIFNAIDFLVLPSRNESFGLVFLEAWSCRKPVIGAAIGAVKDVIEDGVDGLLMELDNEKSLQEKMQVLLKDANLKKAMGESGFKKVKENYTWDIIVDRLRKCYISGMTFKN